MNISRSLLCACLMVGCAAPPSTREPAPAQARDQPAALDLEPVALALLRGLRDPERARLALRLDWDDGFDEELRRELRPALSAALRPWVVVLADEADADLARTMAHAAHERPRPTHLARGEAFARPGGWRVTWRLVAVAGGEELAVARHDVERAALTASPAAPRDEPLALTRALLAAAERNDGPSLVAFLHPTLRERWSHRAHATGRDLEGYALAYFAPRTLSDLGPVTGMELKLRRAEAEVEVDFARKHRDVDFTYRRWEGAWRLVLVEDYP